MSRDSTKANKNEKRLRRLTKSVGVAILALGACWLVVLVARPSREPIYKGKTAQQWFEQALLPKQPHDAFVEMGDDAIPFLTKWVNARPTAAERLYVRVLANSPTWLAKKLPAARDWSYYHSRRMLAIRILGDIGARAWFEERSGSAITNAIPELRTALLDTNSSIQLFAAQSIGQIGPAAASTIPQLINFLQISSPSRNDLRAFTQAQIQAYSDSRQQALVSIQAVGSMGPLASNALPSLVRIAKDTNLKATIEALGALANIGPAAAEYLPEITPCLITSLGSFDTSLNFIAARVLICAGLTPEETLVPLSSVAAKTNENAGVLAALALWNRNRQDTNLLNKLKAELHANRRIPLVGHLGALGTNALPFASEIKLAMNDGETNFNRYAVRALRRIEPTAP